MKSHLAETLRFEIDVREFDSNFPSEDMTTSGLHFRSRYLMNHTSHRHGVGLIWKVRTNPFEWYQFLGGAMRSLPG